MNMMRETCRCILPFGSHPGDLVALLPALLEKGAAKPAQINAAQGACMIVESSQSPVE